MDQTHAAIADATRGVALATAAERRENADMVHAINAGLKGRFQCKDVAGEYLDPMVQTGLLASLD